MIKNDNKTDEETDDKTEHSKIFLSSSISKRETVGQFCSTLLIISAFMYPYLQIWGMTKTNNTIFSAPIDYKVIGILFFLVCFSFKVISSSSKIFGVSIKRFLLFSFLILFSIFYYFATGINTLFFAALLGFALHKDSSEEIIQKTGIIAFVFFLIQIILFSFGFVKDIESYLWVRQLENGEKFQRLAFGYGHPNRVFAFFLPVCLSIYYMKPGPWKKIAVFVGGVSSFAIYLTTDTKTLIITGFFLVLSPVIENLLKKHVIFRRLAIIAFPILTACSIAIALLWGGQWDSSVNQSLSYRPAFWQRYIVGGIALIGRTPANSTLFGDGSGDYTPIDNYFLAPLYVGGIVAYFGLCLLHVLLTSSVIKEKNYKLAVVIIQSMIYGISESQLQLGTSLILPFLFAFVLSSRSIEPNIDGD